MRRGKSVLGLSAVLAVVGCNDDPCEKAAPTVHLELVLTGVSPDEVRSLEVLLDAGAEQYRRVYNLENQLADGRTSLSIEIAPAPAEPFELGVDVRAFDASDASGSLVASRAVTMQLQPNGCNDGRIELSSAALPDAGPPEKDAGEADAEPDAGPIDGAPSDAQPVDAEPQDAGSTDAERADAEPMDGGDPANDGGCPDDDGDGVCNIDDNCPSTPNPLQEDTDGVAAFPIAFAPVVTTNPTPVLFTGDPDDSVSDVVPIGFTFEFFATSQTEMRVSTNGFFSFQANPPDGCCEGQAIPDGAAPNNVVALAWNDLYVFSPLDVRYAVEGSAPSRRFILELTDIHICCEPTQNTVTAQAILYEGTNRIEIHTTEQPNDYGFTRGIEGPMGTRAAYLPGETQARFVLSSSAVGFTTGSAPDGIGDACSNAF